ncbi:hypothetical protein D3C87_1777990 [compost metagenome]
MIAIPNNGQKTFLALMAKADFTAIRPSAKVAGTTRLKRTDSQAIRATRANDTSTTASHSAGTATAPATTRVMTAKPAMKTTNMIRETIRLAPSTRSSSLPRRR